MKVCIAGSRTINSFPLVEGCVKTFINLFDPKAVKEIVTGGAKGVDTFGAEIAEGYEITSRLFLADWNKYGKKAGYLRNLEMAEYSDILIAVWDGKSRGTAHMIKAMKDKKKPVYVVTINIEATEIYDNE